MNQGEEIIRRLQQMGFESGFPAKVQLADDAIAEITRLRASQFRWIPFEEQMPRGEPFLIHDRFGGYQIWVGRISPAEVMSTHWAPIPPLPEKSQSEKDDELWRECKNDWPSNLPCMGERMAFLAGLKAAREQKP